MRYLSCKHCNTKTTVAKGKIMLSKIKYFLISPAINFCLFPGVLVCYLWLVRRVQALILNLNRHRKCNCTFIHATTELGSDTNTDCCNTRCWFIAFDVLKGYTFFFFYLLIVCVWFTSATGIAQELFSSFHTGSSYLSLNIKVFFYFSVDNYEKIQHLVKR